MPCLHGWGTEAGFSVIFLAGNPPKKLSKVGVLDERSMNKSKKRNAGAPLESPSTLKINEIARFGIHPRIHRIHRKWWQDPRLRPHYPRAPGARMTVVSKNSLKLIGAYAAHAKPSLKQECCAVAA